MAEAFIVSAEAEHDIAEAYAWYEARSAGLGEYFLERLAECFDAIRQRPMMFEIAVDEYRRALMHRFPYAVFFELVDEQIIVDAVFHCSQDPGKWRRRLHRDK